MTRTPPRDQRKVTFIKAHLRDEAEWREVVIGNVSARGVMVKCREPPPVGSEVEIRRRGVCILGKVAWASRSRFGVRSYEPIDAEALLGESGLGQPKIERPGLKIIGTGERDATKRRLSWLDADRLL